MNIFYKIFITTMNFLRSLFGYKTAIRIKDLGDAAITAVVGGCIVAWLWATFWLEVEIDPKLREDLIILEMETSPRRYTINPKGVFGVIVGFIAWCIVRASRQDSYKVTSIRRVIIILMIIGLIVVAFGLLFILWDYIPDGVE
ncbi:MAG: hypothetical protein P4L69_04670 [Desulfosporosinus sp.]|nr:hypothetical protein [Desulfosporosinus sp.]